MSLLAEEFQKCINNFEERSPVTTGANRVDAIMRGEIALSQYEEGLKWVISSVGTIHGLEKLKENYQVISKKPFDKNHPLYSLYLERRAVIRNKNKETSLKNTAENPRDSEMPSLRR